MDDDAQRRADRRRRSYEGAIVAGNSKPRLRDESFTIARLEEMWELCVAQWQAGGRELPSFSRSDMPGEVFRIER